MQFIYDLRKNKLYIVLILGLHNEIATNFSKSTVQNNYSIEYSWYIANILFLYNPIYHFINATYIGYNSVRYQYCKYLCVLQIVILHDQFFCAK